MTDSGSPSAPYRHSLDGASSMSSMSSHAYCNSPQIKPHGQTTFHNALVNASTSIAADASPANTAWFTPLPYHENGLYSGDRASATPGDLEKFYTPALPSLFLGSTRQVGETPLLYEPREEAEEQPDGIPRRVNFPGNSAQSAPLRNASLSVKHVQQADQEQTYLYHETSNISMGRSSESPPLEPSFLQPHWSTRSHSSMSELTDPNADPTSPLQQAQSWPSEEISPQKNTWANIGTTDSYDKETDSNGGLTNLRIVQPDPAEADELETLHSTHSSGSNADDYDLSALIASGSDHHYGFTDNVEEGDQDEPVDEHEHDCKSENIPPCTNTESSAVCLQQQMEDQDYVTTHDSELPQPTAVDTKVDVQSVPMSAAMQASSGLAKTKMSGASNVQGSIVDSSDVDMPDDQNVTDSDTSNNPVASVTATPTQNLVDTPCSATVLSHANEGCRAAAAAAATTSDHPPVTPFLLKRFHAADDEAEFKFDSPSMSPGFRSPATALLNPGAWQATTKTGTHAATTLELSANAVSKPTPSSFTEPACIAKGSSHASADGTSTTHLHSAVDCVKQPPAAAVSNDAKQEVKLQTHSGYNSTRVGLPSWRKQPNAGSSAAPKDTADHQLVVKHVNKQHVKSAQPAGSLAQADGAPDKPAATLRSQAHQAARPTAKPGTQAPSRMHANATKGQNTVTPQQQYSTPLRSTQSKPRSDAQSACRSAATSASYPRSTAKSSQVPRAPEPARTPAPTTATPTASTNRSVAARREASASRLAKDKDTTPQSGVTTARGKQAVPTQPLTKASTTKVNQPSAQALMIREPTEPINAVKGKEATNSSIVNQQTSGAVRANRGGNTGKAADARAGCHAVRKPAGDGSAQAVNTKARAGPAAASAASASKQETPKAADVVPELTFSVVSPAKPSSNRRTPTNHAIANSSGRTTNKPTASHKRSSSQASQLVLSAKTHALSAAAKAAVQAADASSSATKSTSASKSKLYVINSPPKAESSKSTGTSMVVTERVAKLVTALMDSGIAQEQVEVKEADITTPHASSLAGSKQLLLSPLERVSSLGRSTGQRSSTPNARYASVGGTAAATNPVSASCSVQQQLVAVSDDKSPAVQVLATVVGSSKQHSSSSSHANKPSQAGATRKADYNELHPGAKALTDAATAAKERLARRNAFKAPGVHATGTNHGALCNSKAAGTRQQAAHAMPVESKAEAASQPKQSGYVARNAAKPAAAMNKPITKVQDKCGKGSSAQGSVQAMNAVKNGIQSAGANTSNGGKSGKEVLYQHSRPAANPANNMQPAKGSTPAVSEQALYKTPDKQVSATRKPGWKASPVKSPVSFGKGAGVAASTQAATPTIFKHQNKAAVPVETAKATSGDVNEAHRPAALPAKNWQNLLVDTPSSSISVLPTTTNVQAIPEIQPIDDDNNTNTLLFGPPSSNQYSFGFGNTVSTSNGVAHRQNPGSLSVQTTSDVQHGSNKPLSPLFPMPPQQNVPGNDVASKTDGDMTWQDQRFENDELFGAKPRLTFESSGYESEVAAHITCFVGDNDAAMQQDCFSPVMTGFQSPAKCLSPASNTRPKGFGYVYEQAPAPCLLSTAEALLPPPTKKPVDIPQLRMTSEILGVSNNPSKRSSVAVAPKQPMLPTRMSILE